MPDTPSFRQVDVENPHFQLPFRFGGINGAAFVNEQDSIEDVVQCVETIIQYPIGSRFDVPDFGIPDVTFKSSSKAEIVPDQVKTSILQWEERAAQDVEGIDVLSDQFLQGLIYRVGASNG